MLTIIQKIILMLVPLVFAITVHEVAHGWVANKLGDPTAKHAGRLTLNPIKHIDPLGTIVIPGLLLLLGGIVFGYAKPVPINMYNLKKIRRDMILVAIAGPISNLLMAIAWGLLAKIGLMVMPHQQQTGLVLFYMSIYGISINIILMLLNLIPIPPLDGSRVVACLLRGKIARQYASIEPYGFLILLALVLFGIMSHILSPGYVFFSDWITNLYNLPV